MRLSQGAFGAICGCLLKISVCLAGVRARALFAIPRLRPPEPKLIQLSQSPPPGTD